MLCWLVTFSCKRVSNVHHDVQLCDVKLIYFRERVWTPHQSDSRNEWLSSVVFLGESSTDVQLEFVARNLETTLSVDIDDVVVSEQCGKFWA